MAEMHAQQQQHAASQSQFQVQHAQLGLAGNQSVPWNTYGEYPPRNSLTATYPHSQQGYSNSISSYHLNSTPTTYYDPVSGGKQEMVEHKMHPNQTSYPYSHYAAAAAAGNMLQMDKRDEYAGTTTTGSATVTANNTAISSPDDGAAGSVENVLMQHRPSDSQYPSDVSRLPSPSSKRSIIIPNTPLNNPGVTQEEAA
jgi:hypothetical protein